MVQENACPVDHSTISECPVDHNSINPNNLIPNNLENVNPLAAHLPSNRIISSIPRGNSDENWKYPSEQMFFNAMAKKGHKPHPDDIKYILFMHNVVNEKCWVDILKWEKQLHGDVEMERKLVRFMGKPKVQSIKSRIMQFMGYTAPFDRHDWVVDRNGKHVRYIIDFYQGQTDNPDVPSVYLDVRPSPDSLENVIDRVKMSWKTKTWK